MSKLCNPEQNELVFTVKDDPYTLIEPGQYEVIYLKYERKPYRGGWKLYVWFQIATGNNAGLKLFRAYNFYEPLRRSSDLYKDLVKLHGGNVPRGHKLPLKLFANRVLLVKVRTVEKGYRQTVLADDSRYSVIDQIIRAETETQK